MKTAAVQAREKAGLERAEAARLAGCCESYLRQIENGRGACSFPLAQRLGRLYGCSLNVFLTKQGRQTPATGTTSRAHQAAH